MGGRWNRRGRAVVYLAEHPALAVLEVRVHLDLPPELLPDDYVLVRVLLPGGSMSTVDAVPDGPMATGPIATGPMATGPIATGDAWLMAAETAVLRVPSVLVPHAWNLLLNPAHPAAADARILAEQPFRFDPRLWVAPL